MQNFITEKAIMKQIDVFEMLKRREMSQSDAALKKGAFSVAAIVDTFSDDFDIPLNIYFAECVRGLVLSTASVCAASYYQNKFEQQECIEEANNA